MNLTSALDYFIAVSGILIIIISFVWNIYEVFMHKSGRSHSTQDKNSDHSADSAIR